MSKTKRIVKLRNVYDTSIAFRVIARWHAASCRNLRCSVYHDSVSILTSIYPHKDHAARSWIRTLIFSSFAGLRRKVSCAIVWAALRSGGIFTCFLISFYGPRLEHPPSTSLAHISLLSASIFFSLSHTPLKCPRLIRIVFLMPACVCVWMRNGTLRFQT